MRIDGSGNIPGWATYQKSSRPAHDHKENVPSKQKDEVEISPAAQELLKREGVRDPQQIERERRIQELKELVQSGRYYVNSEELADRLLRHLLK